MRIRWRGFELPTRVALDQKSSSGVYGKFIVEPFERGFGVSIGNSLRRVLLSSIEGAAVSRIKIEGVQHQFSAIPGVVEDVTDLVLNIKKLLLKMDTAGTENLSLDFSHDGGEKHVTAEMIECPTGVEVVNKDLLLFTATEATSLHIDFTAETGRGYRPGLESIDAETEIGIIPVDAIFSPVQKVRFSTQDTRVGQVTNYDRLILEIWTDGSIKPEDALVEGAKILRKHLNPFVFYEDLGSDLVGVPEEGMEGTSTNSDLEEMLNASITTLDLSVRARNCIEAGNFRTIRDLVTMTEGELLKIRNFGKTSLREVKKKLEDRNLSLGLDVGTYKPRV